MFSCSDASITVWHYDYFTGEGRASYFALYWVVKRGPCVVVCLLVLFVPLVLVGYVM